MFRRTHAWNRFLCLALLAMSAMLTPTQARAADHRDGPLISNTSVFTGNLDLNDLFVFVSPTNPNNSVLILTTGGNGVGFISPPFFSPGAIYEFRIDNSSPPDSVDDLIFTFIFSNPDAALRQSLNWLVAASCAARRDLSSLFVDRWRLPMSPETRQALARIAWSNPDTEASAVLKHLPPPKVSQQPQSGLSSGR